MKNLTFLALLFLSITGSAQTNFKWEKVDSISKKKEQIYSDTKMFIAQQWKSAKDVIQNDDKDAGIILLKGIAEKQVTFMGGSYIYQYAYSVSFKIKDNKYKINIDNVFCNNAYMASTLRKITPIQVFEGANCPETGTLKNPGINKKSAIKMMPDLKKDLQAIIDNYSSYISKPTTAEGW